MPVISFLGSTSMAALRERLNETGYIEGQNFAIEYRWAEEYYDRLPALAADLISRKVDLLAGRSDAPAHAAKGATFRILKRRHRKRDRCRFQNPQPSACRHARYRCGSVLGQPTRTARSVGRGIPFRPCIF